MLTEHLRDLFGPEVSGKIEGGTSIRFFDIPRSLEDLPKANCPFDNTPATISTLVHAIDTVDGIVACFTPGYRCNDCGAEIFDNIADKLAIEGELEFVDPEKDLELYHALQKDLTSQF